MDKLKPDLYIKSIFDLDLEKLKNKGIKNLIVDIDNTIIEWDNSIISSALKSWFNKIKEKGFKVCFVSNNTKKRAGYFTKNLEIPAVHRAVKPRKKAFKKALEIMGADTNDTAVIGDQLFTDVLGGKRMGLFTVLVIPMGNKEFFGTRLVRMVERNILKRKKCVVKGLNNEKQ